MIKTEFSAGVILYRQLKDSREYLLLHYPGGHFDFPKGHLEQDETEREAAYRELKEETGIDRVIWIEGFREKMHYFFMMKGVKISKYVTFFLARTSQKKVTISFEHRDALWLPYEEAYQKLTFEKGKEFLAKAEKSLKKFEEIKA